MLTQSGRGYFPLTSGCTQVHASTYMPASTYMLAHIAALRTHTGTCIHIHACPYSSTHPHPHRHMNPHTCLPIQQYHTHTHTHMHTLKESRQSLRGHSSLKGPREQKHQSCRSWCRNPAFSHKLLSHCRFSCFHIPPPSIFSPPYSTNRKQQPSALWPRGASVIPVQMKWPCLSMQILIRFRRKGEARREQWLW